MDALLRLKKYLKPNKKSLILFTILVLLIITAGAEAVFNPQLLENQIGTVQSTVESLKRAKPWIQPSQAYLNTDKDRLIIKFKIASRDKEKIQAFSNNLGVSQEYLKGLTLSLDQNSIDKLSQFSPISLILEVSDKKIRFFTPGIKGLESSLVKDQIDFSTGSAKLEAKVRGEKEMLVTLSEPKPLLQYVTESGQISLSDKLLPLFPILEKIATIKIDLNGNHLEGEVVLK